MYQYRATIVRIIDGDTCTMAISLGFDIQYTLKCRLANINAPELPTPDGVAAAAYLKTLLAPSLIVTTKRDSKDNYGRYLASIFSPVEPISPDFIPPTLPDHAYTNIVDEHGKLVKCINVSQAMLATGHAKPYPAVKP